MALAFKVSHRLPELPTGKPPRTRAGGRSAAEASSGRGQALLFNGGVHVAGRSIAVQGFNENASIVVMLAGLMRRARRAEAPRRGATPATPPTSARPVNPA